MVSSWRAPLLTVVLAAAGCSAVRLDSERSYERYLALQDLSESDRLSAIAVALEDPDWRVSATACALAQKHRLRAITPRVAAILRRGRLDDARIEHLIRLLGSLGAAHSKKYAKVVTRYLKHSRPSVRAQALWAMSSERLGSAGFEAQIATSLHDPDPRIRKIAATVLTGYRTREAQIYVARAHGRWDDLARRGEIDVLLDSIKSAPEAERLSILIKARAAGRPLMLAVLRSPALSELHPQAYSSLAGDGGPKTPEMQQFELRFRVLIEPKLVELLGRCGTPEWPAAWESLLRLAMRPGFGFLEIGKRMRTACPSGSRSSVVLDPQSQGRAPTDGAGP